jgi:hypothetical protein
MVVQAMPAITTYITMPDGERRTAHLEQVCPLRAIVFVYQRNLVQWTLGALPEPFPNFQTMASSCPDESEQPRSAPVSTQK